MMAAQEGRTGERFFSPADLDQNHLLLSSLFFFLLSLGFSRKLLEEMKGGMLLVAGLVVFCLSSFASGLHFYLEPGQKLCFLEDVPKSTHVVGEPSRPILTPCRHFDLSPR